MCKWYYIIVRVYTAMFQHSIKMTNLNIWWTEQSMHFRPHHTVLSWYIERLIVIVFSISGVLYVFCCLWWGMPFTTHQSCQSNNCFLAKRSIATTMVVIYSADCPVGILLHLVCCGEVPMVVDPLQFLDTITLIVFQMYN